LDKVFNFRASTAVLGRALAQLAQVGPVAVPLRWVAMAHLLSGETVAQGSLHLLPAHLLLALAVGLGQTWHKLQEPGVLVVAEMSIRLGQSTLVGVAVLPAHPQALAVGLGL
jgi:hypothetical protein